MTTTVSNLVLLAGSVSSPSMISYLDNDTGFFSDSINNIAFSHNGTKKLILNNGIEFLPTSETTITDSTEANYSKVFIDDQLTLRSVNSTGVLKVAGSTPSFLPNDSFSNFTLYGLQLYISLICGEDNLTNGTYTAGTAVAGAYFGSVYSPVQNRIYFVPYAQATQANWHYIDCSNGTTVSYAHGATGLVNFAYIGGCYSPTQNRIYFIPYGQSNQTRWHYIDCDTGNVVGYLCGVTVQPFGYIGGCYSPTQNRIYFAPYGQATIINSWNYIDCNTGTVLSYNSLATVVSNAYAGAVYSPNQNRIYFVPFAQATQANWHYINCNIGAIVAYSNNSGTTPVSNAYWGGCFSPTQNRIYFAPYGQGPQLRWHYIDCSTSKVVSYLNGAAAVSNAYVGAVYFPTENRIYFVPFGQANQAVWHYLNCDVGGIITGSTISTYDALTNVLFAYAGGTFSPLENKLYFAPFQQATQATWDYLTDEENNGNLADKDLLAGPLFNKI